MKSISIGSWAYTIGPYAKSPVAFDTVCTRLVDLGFDGVELGSFKPHPNPDDLPKKAERAALSAQMKTWGLSFSGLVANLWGEHLIDTEDTTHYVEEFRKNCAFGKDLGIKGIRVDTVQPPTIFEKVDPKLAFQRVTGAWNQCARIAKEHGLYVCWEFEPGFAFNKPSEILSVLEAVPHDNFGILYDTSHGHMCSVVGAR